MFVNVMVYDEFTTVVSDVEIKFRDEFIINGDSYKAWEVRFLNQQWAAVCYPLEAFNKKAVRIYGK